MRQVIFILGVSVLIFSISSTVGAVDKDSGYQLIEDYVNAVHRLDDQKKINALYDQITANKDIVRYLYEHKPDVFKLYKTRGLAYRLESLREEYFGKLQGGVISSNRQITGSSLGSRHTDNRDRVLRSPTKVRKQSDMTRVRFSNGDRVRQFSNQDRVRRNPNSRARSNQSRLRRRR